jgi:hypothetical protein
MRIVVPLKGVEENLVVNFLATLYQVQDAAMTLLRKSGLVDHFQENATFTEEKLDEIGARLDLAS